MQRYHHGLALTGIVSKCLADLLLVQQIEACNRFVGQKHLGTACKHPRQPHPRLLAA